MASVECRTHVDNTAQICCRFALEDVSARLHVLLEAESSQFYCTVAKNKPCCGAVIPSPWAVSTPPVGGMPHVQLKHQEPGASEQCAGHAAGCCKPHCVWACGTPRGPSNVLPVPLLCVVHVLPAANARRRNKTTLDLSNASKNRLKSGVSYATANTLSSMAGSASQSIASFVACRARTKNLHYRLFGANCNTPPGMNFWLRAAFPMLLTLGWS